MKIKKILVLTFFVSCFISSNTYAQLGGFLDKLKKDIEKIIDQPTSDNSVNTIPLSTTTENNKSSVNFDDLGQVEGVIQQKTQRLFENKDFCDFKDSQSRSLCLGMDLKDYIKATKSVLFAPHSIINDQTIPLGSGQILCLDNKCVRNFGEKKRTVEVIARDGVGQPTIPAGARGGVEGSAIDRSNKSRSCVGKGCEELLKQRSKTQSGMQVTIEPKQTNVCHMVFPNISLMPTSNNKNTYQIEKLKNDNFQVYKFNIIDCSFGEIWNGFKVVKKYRFFTNKLIGISTELYDYESEYDRIEVSRFMTNLTDETKKTYEPYIKLLNENELKVVLIKDKSKMVILDEELQSIANGIGVKYYDDFSHRGSRGAGGNFYIER